MTHILLSRESSDDEELIASRAEYQAVPGGLTQPLADNDQRRITNRPPVGVIHRLEAPDVDQDYRSILGSLGEPGGC